MSGTKKLNEYLELMEEWNWARNEGLNPSDFSCGSSRKVWWKCKNGHEWEAQIKNRSRGSGCKQCYHNRQKNMLPVNGLLKSHEEFLADLRRKNKNDLIIIGKYKTARDLIEWECKSCGKHFFSYAKHIYAMTGFCKECNTKRIAEKTIIESATSFYEKLNKRENAPRLLEDYKGMNFPIKVQCKKCDYVWSASPNNLLKYVHECPECAKIKSRKLHEEFLCEVAKVNQHVKVLGKYIKAISPIKCECLLCGNIWSPRPTTLLNGIGCPSCNHSSTSLVEQMILLSFKKTLEESVIISRDKIAIGSELDIYLPNEKIAVEYGAWHWHKDKIYDDLMKMEACQNMGIKLIIIYDSCKEIPQNITNNNIIFYTKDLGRDKEEAKKMIQAIFDMLNINWTITNNEFQEIIEQAYYLSRKMTTNDFKNKIESVNSNIEILGDYVARNEKIKCKCKVCGHVWNPVPDSLLSGHGCPNCTNHFTNRLTDNQYRLKLKEKHPNITLMETYKNGREIKMFKCEMCGLIWNEQPKSVLRGNGCPVCRKKKNNM